jgi:hypothetical protein
VSKGGSKVSETPAQRAMAEFAMNQLQDYKQRWLPVQKRLAMQIQESGAADSSAREQASGRASTDAAMQFAQAEGALQKTLANKGVNVGSSRAKLAITGMGEDKAKTTGIGGMIADQQIDDAYTQGLMALTSIGRGERAQVNAGLESQASQSARDAATSAQISAGQRAGEMQLAGQAAGMGLYGALNRVPNVPDIGMTTNNTGMQLPTAGGQ